MGANHGARSCHSSLASSTCNLSYSRQSGGISRSAAVLAPNPFLTAQLTSSCLVSSPSCPERGRQCSERSSNECLRLRDLGIRLASGELHKELPHPHSQCESKPPRVFSQSLPRITARVFLMASSGILRRLSPRARKVPSNSWSLDHFCREGWMLRVWRPPGLGSTATRFDPIGALTHGRS